MSIKEEIFSAVRPEVPRVLAGQQLFIYIPEHLDGPKLAENIAQLRNKLSSTEEQLRNDLLLKKPDGGNPLIDANNKITMTYLPDAILGQLVFGGTATLFDYGTGNNAITVSLTSNAKEKLNTTNNSIIITEADDFTQYQGLYFIASAGGRDTSITFCGLTIRVGDWLVATAGGWQRIDNTGPVQSVANRTGNIVLSTVDIVDLPEKLAKIENRLTITILEEDDDIYELFGN